MEMPRFCLAFREYLKTAKANGWRVDLKRFADEAGKWAEEAEEKQAIAQRSKDWADANLAMMERNKKRAAEAAAQNG
jgi:hypothetical protein